MVKLLNVIHLILMIKNVHQNIHVNTLQNINVINAVAKKELKKINLAYQVINLIAKKKLLKLFCIVRIF